MIVAILIGREGSVGFPGKNTFPVLGRPLVSYPLAAAAAAPSVGRLYVSTDSAALSDVAMQFDARLLERPAHLATKEALGEDAYIDAYHRIRADLQADGGDIELLVLLMANAPTISAAIIENGIKILRDKPDLDSAVTVSCYNMWSPLRARKIDNNGLLQPFVPYETFGDPKTLNCDRDSQGDAWFADMGVSIIRPSNLDCIDEGLLPQKWMGRRIWPLRQVGGLDIDYDWQTPQAEFWLRAQGVQPA